MAVVLVLSVLYVGLWLLGGGGGAFFMICPVIVLSLCLVHCIVIIWLETRELFSLVGGMRAVCHVFAVNHDVICLFCDSATS